MVLTDIVLWYHVYFYGVFLLPGNIFKEKCIFKKSISKKNKMIFLLFFQNISFFKDTFLKDTFLLKNISWQ